MVAELRGHFAKGQLNTIASPNQNMHIATLQLHLKSVAAATSK